MKISVLAVGIVFLSACPAPASETAARVRNGIVGGEHALELNGCIAKAKAADVPDQYVVYEDCAHRVDVKYGRKGGVK